MKLFLMRHAHAEININTNDFNRNLSEIGKSQAQAAGEFLNKYQIDIDKMLVSHAKRTLQTAQIFQEHWKFLNTEITEKLYKSTEQSIIDLIINQPSNVKNLLVLGHNPQIYNLALDLAHQESELYDMLISTMMPPARIIILDFPGINGWYELADKKGDIVEIFTP